MSEFVSYLHEVFHDFGTISHRRMFGGFGIYHQGLMFALVADDNLYFKSDAENRDEFLNAGCSPFRYESKGQLRSMAYYSAPDSCLDEPEQACYWAKLAYQAALRAQAAKVTKPKKKAGS